VSLLLGFITFFLLGLILRAPDFPASRVFPDMMRILFTDKSAWIGWLIILAVYFLVLVVRSIIWSVNMLRRP